MAVRANNRYDSATSFPDIHPEPDNPGGLPWDWTRFCKREEQADRQHICDRTVYVASDMDTVSWVYLGLVLHQESA